ncbi:MAG TPA: two pore domain potassium channel family protein [Sulfurovum sp.]|nr:two pore domain potassium channel family protein [Sulfurovum sp.]
MKQLTHDNNFVYLCGALIALLFSAALVQEFSGTWGEDIFTLTSMLMLVVSIKSVHTDMTWKKTVYVLLGFLFILSILAKVFAFAYSMYLNLIILLLFFAGSFWTAYKQILFEGKVDTNKMIGSLSLYLLLGLMWTILYLILIELDSQSFSGLESGSWKQNFSQVAYYSFVTLTTLGYGDILPVNKVAQFFVYMEAVVGVFYMAIIVSSLISLRLTSLEKKE